MGNLKNQKSLETSTFQGIFVSCPSWISSADPERVNAQTNPFLLRKIFVVRLVPRTSKGSSSKVVGELKKPEF
jgi:hypothetical protein